MGCFVFVEVHDQSPALPASVVFSSDERQDTQFSQVCGLGMRFVRVEGIEMLDTLVPGLYIYLGH